MERIGDRTLRGRRKIEWLRALRVLLESRVHGRPGASPRKRLGKENNMEKQKIRLTQEKETLLVPLYSKAIESQRAHPIIVDPKAEEILQGIEYDFGKLKVPKKTLVTLAMRAKRLDSYVQDYLDHTENPLVLHLGCGLDSRVLRVGAL
jgi:O-methyltransferase involved in polyketide biosynthesis